MWPFRAKGRLLNYGQIKFKPDEIVGEDTYLDLEQVKFIDPLRGQEVILIYGPKLKDDYIGRIGLSYQEFDKIKFLSPIEFFEHCSKTIHRKFARFVQDQLDKLKPDQEEEIISWKSDLERLYAYNDRIIFIFPKRTIFKLKEK